MPYVNRVTLIGNLTRDPQLKQLPSNSTVAEFGMAMNRRYKSATGEEREEVCFVDCSAFGKAADNIGKYCKKGRQLYVEGRLKFDQWDDKTGGKRSKLSIVVENFQFLGARDENNAPGAQRTFFDPDQRLQKGNDPVHAGTVIRDNEGFTDADIPF
jgi:single-strand DNA-binding protein